MTDSSKPRHDIYVRIGNVMRAGLRTVDIGDGVAIDYQPDQHGVDRAVGVEVLEAGGVEIDGLNVVPGTERDGDWRNRLELWLASPKHPLDLDDVLAALDEIDRLRVAAILARGGEQ